MVEKDSDPFKRDILVANEDGSPFISIGREIPIEIANVIVLPSDDFAVEDNSWEYVAAQLPDLPDLQEAKERAERTSASVERFESGLFLVSIDMSAPSGFENYRRALDLLLLSERWKVPQNSIVWTPVRPGTSGRKRLKFPDIAGVLAEISRENPEFFSPIKEFVFSTREYLSNDGYSAVVNAFHEAKIEPPARTSSEKGTNSPSSDPELSTPPLAQDADFRSDRPIEDMANDALDRDIVAKAIYKKINDYWTEDDDAPPPPYPFMVHVAGRWGSGKSTILKFLEQILKADTTLTPPTSGRTRDDHKSWVVVNFNAWQQQAKRPAWWSLLSAVAEQSATQMTPQQSSWFAWQNWKFRFRTNGGPRNAGMAAVVLVVVAVFWALNLPEAPPKSNDATTTVETTTTTTDPVKPDTPETVTVTTVNKQQDVTKESKTPPQNSDLKSLLVNLAALLTAAGTIWGFWKGFMSRADNTAGQFDALDDPAAPLKERFCEMIREIHRPVAIFIDDLDRCDADYVVELLQAIQTIYDDVPVLYVVAADRDWMVSAYDQTYKGFKTDIDKPGQPLGYLFVKKIFQLSVNIPDLDSDYGRTFLEAQLLDDDQTPLADVEIETIEAQVLAAPTLEAANKIIEAQTSPAAKRVAGSAAFLKSFTAEAQEEVTHLLVDKLTKPEMLLDPNPRAIKRLVNAYSFRSGFARSTGQTQVIDKLPYWCTLDLRFPYSAERLTAQPELALDDAWKTDGMTEKDDGTFVGTNRHFPKEDQTEIGKILQHLDADDIRELRLYG